ncbi:hypothetical protein C8Q78DRAFT_628661 [Trametes maxima]|nr:hypothetical protein C8Q78DRAFT_628661 [Trametes maxima]
MGPRSPRTCWSIAEPARAKLKRHRSSARVAVCPGRSGRGVGRSSAEGGRRPGRGPWAERGLPTHTMTSWPDVATGGETPRVLGSGEGQLCLGAAGRHARPPRLSTSLAGGGTAPCGVGPNTGPTSPHSGARAISAAGEPAVGPVADSPDCCVRAPLVDRRSPASSHTAATARWPRPHTCTVPLAPAPAAQRPGRSAKGRAAGLTWHIEARGVRTEFRSGPTASNQGPSRPGRFTRPRALSARTPITRPPGPHPAAWVRFALERARHKGGRLVRTSAPPHDAAARPCDMAAGSHLHLEGGRTGPSDSSDPYNDRNTAHSLASPVRLPAVFVPCVSCYGDLPVSGKNRLSQSYSAYSGKTSNTVHTTHTISAPSGSDRAITLTSGWFKRWGRL